MAFSDAGQFDETLLISGWFDETAADSGWFDDELLKDSTASGASVIPGVGSLAISGYAPGVIQPIVAQPTAGGLSITGLAPTVAQPHGIAAGAGSVAITGLAPSIAQPQTSAPSYGSLAIVGYAPSVEQANASPGVAPGAGGLSLAGYVPAVEQSQLTATAGGGLRRKRVFIDGKTYFLNPQEVARLLIERAAAAAPADTPEETAGQEAVADVAPDNSPDIGYAAVNAASVQASQAFIDLMNAEIERLRALDIQRQLDEEDDIECLMLLI